MGPPLYMWYVPDQSVIMWCITVNVLGPTFPPYMKTFLHINVIFFWVQKRSQIWSYECNLSGVLSFQRVLHTITALAISSLTTASIFQYDQTIVYRKLLYYWCHRRVNQYMRYPSPRNQRKWKVGSPELVWLLWLTMWVPWLRVQFGEDG